MPDDQRIPDLTQGNIEFLNKMLEVQETANMALESIERARLRPGMQVMDGWLTGLRDLIMTQQVIMNALAEENTRILNLIQRRVDEAIRSIGQNPPQ